MSLRGSSSLGEEFPKHFEQVVDEDDRRVFLYLVGCEPGLVTAELVLLGRGEIAVSSVGQFHDEGVGSRITLATDHATIGLRADGRIFIDGQEIYSEAKGMQTVLGRPLKLN